MKNIKVLWGFLISVCLASCASSNNLSSNKVSSNVSENIIKLKSSQEISKSLDGFYGVSFSYSINNEDGEISFDKGNNLISYTKKIGNDVDTKLIKSESAGNFYYEKKESSYYNFLSIKNENSYDVDNELKIYLFAEKRINYKTKEELIFLNRESIKYSFENDDINKNIEGNVVVDKESGLIFSFDVKQKFDINGVNEERHQTLTVNEFRSGNEVKNTMESLKNSIKVDIFSSTTLEDFGLVGEPSVPGFPIKECTSTLVNDNLEKYEITYADSINSGNDPYINQYESLVMSLYGSGFTSNEKFEQRDFNDLLINSTVDYAADYDFVAYQAKNNKSYRLTSTLDIIDRIATLYLSIEIIG